MRQHSHKLDKISRITVASEPNIGEAVIPMDYERFRGTLMEFELTTPLLSWTSSASHLIGEYFDFVKPYIDQEYDGIHPQVRFVNAQLFIDCHLTSESVLILVRAQKEWDADLITRSVVEGTLKYVYMLVGTAEESRQKVVEFWETLPSFATVRRSERAKTILEKVEDPESIRWKPFRELVLSDAQIASARDGTNRQARKRLDEQWSFSGIVHHFNQSNERELNAFAGLALGYANSSHLIHKDGDGVAMVWERYRRDPSRQAAIKLAHSARLVSDVCVFAEIRARYLLRACGVPASGIDSICTRYTELFKKLQEAYELFTEIEYESEDTVV